ncbi:TPA_asm: fiber, partial [Powellomyces chytrid fungus MELD virus 2]
GSKEHLLLTRLNRQNNKRYELFSKSSIKNRSPFSDQPVFDRTFSKSSSKLLYKDMSGINSRTSSGLLNLEDTNLISPVVSGDMKGWTKNAKILNFQSIHADALQNRHGDLLINDVLDESPISIRTENGVAIVGLNVDEEYLCIDNVTGALKYEPDRYEFPLTHDRSSKTVDILTNEPLGVSQDGLTLFHDKTLEVTENGDLSVIFPPKETVVEPLIRDADGIKLQHGETMKVTHGMLGIDYQDPIYMNMQQQLTIDHDTSLVVTAEGKLSAVPEALQAPIARNSENHISLNIGKGLQVNDDGELQTDLNNILKPLGALHANGLFDLADDFVEYGYEAIDEIFGDGEDTEVKLLRLKTSSDFTQKGLLSGSKILSIQNRGANCIPYYPQISDEFKTDDTFRYNSTLNELHVGHVSLNANDSPNNNEAITAGYAEQLYLSETGSPVDVSALSNGRRTLILECGVSPHSTLVLTLDPNLESPARTHDRYT